MKFDIEDKIQSQNQIELLNVISFRFRTLGSKFQVSSFKLLFLCISFFLFWFNVAQGATLYLEPSSGEYQIGDTFLVEIKIDTEGECVNAIKANLSFSQDILKAIDFSQGNSILTLWIKSPTIDQESGRISFIGGIPGGYCGRMPGDPGESNLLGKIIFKADQDVANQAEVKFLDTSQVLLNDGFGTPAKLITKGAMFTILPEKIDVPRDEWEEKLKKDNILPESFEIEIQQDPTIFEGKYFIIFSTADKQTGIDRYEIKEGKRDWREVTSPHLLEDQSLRSIIKVKAIDKAGNERIAELPPTKPFPYWLIIVILFGIVVWWVIKRFKK